MMMTFYKFGMRCIELLRGFLNKMADSRSRQREWKVSLEYFVSESNKLLKNWWR